MIVVYVLADFGSVGGGWLSSALIKRNWTVNGARKTAMLVCALLILPVGTTTSIHQVDLLTLDGNFTDENPSIEKTGKIHQIRFDGIFTHPIVDTFG